MTGPSSDEQPTTVLPQSTPERPAVTVAPATRRARIWQRKVPARIGRARTSTVVIGCLFVLLSAINSTLPQPDAGSTSVVLPSGRTVSVPNTALPSDVRPTTAAPAGTTAAPSATSAAPSTQQAPASTSSTVGRRSSSSAPATTVGAPASSAAPTTSSAPTSLAPSSEPAPATSVVPTSSAPTS
jgi:hypothetical protein